MYKTRTTFKSRFIFLLILSLAVTGMALLMAKPGDSRAAQYGAAFGINVIEQSCTENGAVNAKVIWAPSGWGSQWADITTLNDNFSSHWLDAGPLNPVQNSMTWEQLQPNVSYYTRLNTLSTGGWLPSDTMAFRTISCAFTAPTNLLASPLSPTSERLAWTKGANNHWSCVDTALNVNDLVSFSGSYRYHACGSTGNVLDLNGLTCATTYYWRVYAQGPAGGGHSQVASFRTQDCAFSPATGLKGTALSANSIRFEWTKGTNNDWFCVDVAKTTSDLHSFRGSWSNHGCGSNRTSLTVNDLACGTTYYWRVFAVGAGVGAHSETASTRTRACEPAVETQQAPVEEAKVIVQESFPPKYVLSLTLGLPGGCAKYLSQDVERDGKLIRVEVLNSVETNRPCLDIYNTYKLSIPLGSNFQSGVTYTVNVNGTLVHFKAQ